MGAMECWDDLAEDKVVVVVVVMGVVGWVWVELLVWQGFEEKIRLTKAQEEERALLVLNEGEGRER